MFHWIRNVLPICSAESIGQALPRFVDSKFGVADGFVLKRQQLTSSTSRRHAKEVAVSNNQGRSHQGK